MATRQGFSDEIFKSQQSKKQRGRRTGNGRGAI
jgi:hypothetical protein